MIKDSLFRATYSRHYSSEMYGTIILVAAKFISLHATIVKCHLKSQDGVLCS